MPVDVETWVSVVNQILQSVFFIVVAIVTVITYIRARKTILQPIRTELFKTQLQELSAVLKLFVGQGEVALREKFQFPKLLRVNMVSLYDDYASLFFDVEFDPDTRPYNRRECPLAILTQEFVDKYVQLADDHVLPEDTSESETERPDPRLRAALWQDYKFGEIRIPREYSETHDQLIEILESPVLPKNCVELLESFLETVDRNTNLVAEVLTECATELPEKYPTIEALQRSSFLWIHNRYNDAFEDLKPKADKVVDFVRSHWSVDEILEI